jgi:hypothetical protein
MKNPFYTDYPEERGRTAYFIRNLFIAIASNCCIGAAVCLAIVILRGLT